MGITSNGFISADLAGQNSSTNLIIHQEISAIETEILTQSNLGFGSCSVNSSYMTNNDFPSAVEVLTISTSNDTITLDGSNDFQSGQPILLSSTDTLPL